MLSLLLFIIVSIPVAIRSKLRSRFPVRYTSQRTVVALTYSPFCEKVFWSYDRCKVSYATRVVSQGFFPTTLLEYSAKSVPIIVDNGRVLRDSSMVLDGLSEEGHAWLYPSQAVRDLEGEFDEEFGRAVGRVVYHHLFTSEKGNALLRRVWKVGVTPLERMLTDPLYPACRFAMMGGMGLPDGLPGFVAVVDKVFKRVSALLADGRRYLGSTQEMSAADLTFASLAYPLLLPDEKANVFLSWADDLPEAYREDVRRLRETPAGRFVLRLYREERRV